MRVSARELDLLGARAWPPLEDAFIDGWQLRFSGGVTKRANSVLPLGDNDQPLLGKTVLAERIAAVERSYAAHGLPARFQVTASSQPPDLRDVLAKRGYVESDRTLVMTVELATRQSRHPSSWRIVEQQPEPPRDWLDAWWAADGRGGATELGVARTILARIELPRMFVECHDERGVAGVGLGVLDLPWIGIYCMATLPHARRQGCARSILAHLFSQATMRGAERAHLAVTETNEPARRLYQTFGFETRQEYSYFTLSSV